jgi:hypothetical protein
MIDNNFDMNISGDRNQNQISIILSMLILLFLIAIPITSIFFMSKNIITIQNYKEFEPKTFKKWDQNYGTMFEGLHLWRSISIFYNSLFMIRRLVIALVLVFV